MFFAFVFCLCFSSPDCGVVYMCNDNNCGRGWCHFVFSNLMIVMVIKS